MRGPSPIGVSTLQRTESLALDLKPNLPTIEELEAELGSPEDLS